MIETNLHTAMLVLRVLNSDFNEIKKRYTNLRSDYSKADYKLFYDMHARECANCGQWLHITDMALCDYKSDTLFFIK